MENFNELFDLSAIAGASGLLGGAGGTAVAAAVFSSQIAKFLTRTLMTAALTAVGFYVLLDQLGFEIVAKDAAIAASAPAPAAPGSDEPPTGLAGGPLFPGTPGYGDGVNPYAPRFTAQSVARAPAQLDGAQDEDERVLIVKSPFR